MSTKRSTLGLILCIITLSASVYYTVAQGTTGNLMPFSAAEIQSILDVHNTLRAQVNAKVMPALQWNDGLAALWPTNPNNCVFAHTTQSFRSNVAGFSYAGENLAWSSANMDVSDFISGWGGEKSAYVYGPISINTISATGHYTQEVWADTTTVGCARMDCTNAEAGGYIIACNYGPGGNWAGQYPYQLCDTGSCGMSSPSPVAAASSAPSSSASNHPSTTASLSHTSNPSSSNSPATSPTSSKSTQASSSNSPSQTKAPSASNSPSTSMSTTHSASQSGVPSPSSAPSASASPIPACKPLTSCGTNNCGRLPDGCGGALECGTCSDALATCSTNNTCVSCTPSDTCNSKQCGTINDGCGNTISCGTCSSGETCENNTCVAVPQCKSCQELALECGTVTASADCPILDCGTCATGMTCNLGTCQQISCPNGCGKNQECVGNACQCLAGFSDKNDGNGCTPIPSIPSDFTEIAPAVQAFTIGQSASTVGSTNWIYESDTQGNPMLGMVSDDQQVHKMEWKNAINYSSLELTTFSADVQTPATGSITIGFGLRLGQGTGRELDAVQWKLELVPDISAADARLTIVWTGQEQDYGVRGSIAWNQSLWHNIKVSVFDGTYSGKTWVVSQVFVDGVAVTYKPAIRPYFDLGGAYIYTLGQSTWKNVMLSTATSLRVAISRCLSGAEWQALVASTLNIPPANVVLRNVSDPTGQCVGQATQKRQAAGAAGTSGIGTEFLFTLHSTPTAVSQSLASKFTMMANSMNPALAESGGVVSVSTVPPEAVADMSNIDGTIDVSNQDLIGAGGTGGLSNGAIAGIVIGSVIAVAIVGAILGAAIVGSVFLIRRYLTKKRDDRAVGIEADSIESIPSPNSSFSKAPPSGGVDIYSHDKHKSITARIPSGLSHVAYHV